MTQRIYLTGLAIGPSLVVSIVPLPPLVAPATVALVCAGGVYALLGSVSLGRQRQARDTRAGQSLLRVGQGDLPNTSMPVAHQRARLVSVLHPMPDPFPAPQGRDQAVAEVLRRIVSGWGRREVEDLTVDEVAELVLLDRLLRADAQEAGALAQFFHRPDLMLDLRDEVQEVAALRARHDRNATALQATGVLWASRGDAAGLSEALAQMTAPDPDLWHHVVQDHDRGDPDQREAALWCVEQPSCDRATIAVYLAQLVADNRLAQAAAAGDVAFLSRVRGVIEALNAGRYANAEIGLAPGAVSDLAPEMTRALGALADATGTPRWPLPCGVFCDHPGRPAAPRRAWSLDRGGLAHAPDPSDYI